MGLRVSTGGSLKLPFHCISDGFIGCFFSPSESVQTWFWLRWTGFRWTGISLRWTRLHHLCQRNVIISIIIICRKIWTTIDDLLSFVQRFEPLLTTCARGNSSSSLVWRPTGLTCSYNNDVSYNTQLCSRARKPACTKSCFVVYSCIRLHSRTDQCEE